MFQDFKKQEMIERLRANGITNNSVLKFMKNVPREDYIPPGLKNQAYDEKALPIGFGQTISHPYTVAFMTSLIDPKPEMKILEIGTGSGYQCAVLCESGARVFTVEIDENLAERAKSVLKKFNYNFVSKTGDGSIGWLAYAPYDAIIVTAGAPVIPESLISQLNDPGLIVIPVGDEKEQVLTVIKKIAGEINYIKYDNFRFVPLTGKSGWR